MGNNIAIVLEIPGSKYNCMASKIRRHKQTLHSLYKSLATLRNDISRLGISEPVKDSFARDIEQMESTKTELLKDMHVISTIIQQGEKGTEQRGGTDGHDQAITGQSCGPGDHPGGSHGDPGNHS